MFKHLTTPLLSVVVAALTAGQAASSESETYFGKAETMGRGTIKPYLIVERGAPAVVGLVFESSALEGLPPTPNTTSRCFDLNKNGRIDASGECEGDYELRLPMPQHATDRGDVPFRWAAVNWNPLGHVPQPWQVAHFDFHFYMVSEVDIDMIRVGECEIFIHCDDRERGLIPVATEYVHADHVNVGATVGRMGNHLINSRTPEFAEENPVEFTHTWIFGAYDGHITFYEPMITLEHLNRRESACHPIKQPEAWEVPGYYPTVYCIRYSEQHNTFTVSLEGMRLRSG